jgi:dihydroorotate dehydrogenase
MRLVSSYFNYQDQRLHVAAGGLLFPSPAGLAAGYDKNCEFLGGLLNIGFGYVVGGTVLPMPRPGNPFPRVMRLPSQRSLINAMGFPGKGMLAAKVELERVRQRAKWRSKPILISVAGLTLEEFQKCHAFMEPLADGIELNISSPNTQGLRVFQEPDTFARLLDAIALYRSKPLYVKIPPYFDGEGQDHVLSLVRIAKARGVDGITAANTRPVDAPELAMGQGGLSGRILLEDMVRIVAEVRTEVGPEMAINASGGIFTAEDALRALKAGANTVQLLTGMVYRGAGIARSINRGLVQIMNERGATSLPELVRAEVP